MTWKLLTDIFNIFGMVWVVPPNVESMFDTYLWGIGLRSMRNRYGGVSSFQICGVSGLHRMLGSLVTEIQYIQSFGIDWPSLVPCGLRGMDSTNLQHNWEIIINNNWLSDFIFLYGLLPFVHLLFLSCFCVLLLGFVALWVFVPLGVCLLLCCNLLSLILINILLL